MPNKPGTPPNTSIVLTDTELEFINRHYNGSKSAAIHKALETLMNDAPACDLLPAERIARIAQLADCDTEIAADYINSEWDNQDEHEEWIATATDEEIASWIAACRK